jgi:twitching motility protein PilT
VLDNVPVAEPTTRGAAAPINSTKQDDGTLEHLLRDCINAGGSDLILVTNAAPTVLIGGVWRSLDRPVPNATEIMQLFESRLSSDQRARLRDARDLDFGLHIQGTGRFRVNLHYQRGMPAAAIRAIPVEVPSFDSLGLPRQTLAFAEFPNGLVLVTGGTGQGKSTTLAAMIEHVNQTQAAHIITVEDPIEFDFRNEKSLIEQRQVGDDSPSFASALRHALRQRPDVILIGELRDLETISTALTAAETGHLVFGTLHTNSAVQTISRIVDVFPSAQQPHVRTQLSASLRAIMCQRLVRDDLNGGLLPATELLIASPAVRRNIRDNETHLVYSTLETGRSHGMHTMEQCLLELAQSGRITIDAAVAAASDPVRMRTMLGQATPS